MKFYVGMHHPHNAHRVERAFISANALARRRGPFRAPNAWILDSGAFTTIATHGGYPEPVSAYADLVRKWWMLVPNLARAVSQDWMCEPWMLERTGGTVESHQRMTIERYDELVSALPESLIMPVLQGYSPQDYARHVREYGARLGSGHYVGVGSVCKRQGNPSSIAAVLEAILDERSDLRLHGFGVKIIALQDARVRDRLYSADSMAWSFAARYEGRNANDWREAVRYSRLVNEQSVQESLL